MTANPEQAYLESRVYTASPGELVQMLYEAALEGIQNAIAALEAGDIAQRARSITKATSCVMELAGSLNVAAAGELGVRLAVLYEYLLHELLEANVRQNAEPLRNCERVITSLLEGWTTALAQMGETSAIASDPSGESATAVDAPGPTPTLGSSEPIAPPVSVASPASAYTLPGIAAPASHAAGEEDPFDIEDLQPAMNSWCG